jgi:hypothetical protein
VIVHVPFAAELKFKSPSADKSQVVFPLNEGDIVKIRETLPP